jgi:hypothetical protein
MNNAITPTAQAGLDALAKSWNLSRSELLERIGRGMLQVSAIQQESVGDQGNFYE